MVDNPPADEPHSSPRRVTFRDLLVSDDAPCPVAFCGMVSSTVLEELVWRKE